MDKYAVGVRKGKGIVFAGVLGAPFLQQYRVIFDYAGKKIVLCPPASDKQK